MTNKVVSNFIAQPTGLFFIFKCFIVGGVDVNFKNAIKKKYKKKKKKEIKK